MHARTSIAVAAIVALAAPATSTARLTPIKHSQSQAAKNVRKRHATPRVLCVCMTIPVPPRTEVELEAELDAELIAHGLEPAYASFQTDAELQAAYDAVLAAHGLSPFFKTPTTGVTAA